MLKTLHLSLSANLLALKAYAQLHQKRLSLLGVFALSLGAAGAYAISNAGTERAQSLLDGARVISEPVTADIQSAGGSVEFTLYRTDTVRRNDSNASLLRRLGVNDTQALTFINQSAIARQLANHAGHTVSAQMSAGGELNHLLLRVPHKDQVRFTRLTVKRDRDGSWIANEGTGYLETSSKIAYATIRGPFFSAMDAADIPDSVGAQLIDIFSTDIDFHRVLKRGDGFKIVYETLFADGEWVADGRILAAEFVNRKRVYQAVWFEAPGSQGGYYDFAGNSLRKAYLASPLKYSRISSGFGMREHPIWGNFRQHKGIDYAAPTGTPILSVADGVVKFSGRQGGYGNAVEVLHSSGRSTFYAHMNQLQVRTGQRITQNTVLGTVGSTGSSTGPHLHFEFRIQGDYQDPVLMAKESGAAPLRSVQTRTEFAGVSSAMREQLDNARLISLAKAQ